MQRILRAVLLVALIIAILQGLASIGSGLIGTTHAQVPEPCEIRATPTSLTVSADGGPGTIDVSAPAGCRWSATSSVPAVASLVNSTGNGNGQIAFVTTLNTSIYSRPTLIVVAGDRVSSTVSLTQSGMTAPPSTSIEESEFAPVCDPFTECDIDQYIWQLKPRTGFYDYQWMRFCPSCQAFAGVSADAASTAPPISRWQFGGLDDGAGGPRLPVANMMTDGITAGPNFDVVSVSSAGARALGGGSLSPVLSRDGRFVAFDSAATNLVAGDTNARRDVFVRDRLLGLTTRVSVSTAGTQGDGHSVAPIITPDGRFIAFLSLAVNLVAGDTNGVGDVFVHDRQSGVTERVNMLPTGEQATAASWPSAGGDLVAYEDTILKSEELAMSDDGRYIVFVTELAVPFAGHFNIYLRDRVAGTTTVVQSADPFSSTILSSSATNPTIITTATPHGMVTGDYVEIAGHTGPPINTRPNFHCGFSTDPTVVLAQFVTALSPTTFSIPISVAVSGTGGTATRVQDVRTTARPRVSISSDGRFVAFDWLYQITADDTYRAGSSRGGRCRSTADQRDVYVYDRQGGTSTLVSVDSAGRSANGYSGWPSISGDGRYVAFASEASNLVPGDTDDARNIFIRDRQLRTTIRVSTWRSVSPVISKDGRQVLFAQPQSGFYTAGWTIGIAVFDMQAGTVARINHTDPAVTGEDGASFGVAVSADGSTLAFGSAGTNLVADDTNSEDDVFVITLSAPVITSQPVDAGPVTVGGTAARFTVAATGFPAPNYRWQVSTDAGFSWSDVTIAIPTTIPHGGTNADLYVFATASMNGYRFRAIVSNTRASVTSNAATLSLVAPSFRVRFDFDGNRKGDLAAFLPAGGVWSVNGQQIQWGLPGDVPVPGDYNGDAIADIAVFRPSTGDWFIRNQPTVQWGLPGDIPIPGDYNGDGSSDPAVFRAGAWFVRGQPTRYWGLPGDTPVPADYDGDGKTDLAVVRGGGSWFIWYSVNNFANTVPFAVGEAGDLPVPGDFDGDRRGDLAVFRPSTGRWFIAFAVNNYASLEQHQWGVTGDQPLALDTDGDGADELVTFRPSTREWWIANRVTGPVRVEVLGPAGSIPAPQRPRLPESTWRRVQPTDVDGDGRSDVTVYRPGTGEWLTRQSSNGFNPAAPRQWGLPDDIPVPADYDGDGRSDIAVFRPSSGHWYVQTSTGGFSVTQWGLNGDIPVPADYDGDGRADLAVYRASGGFWYVLQSSAGFSLRQWGLSGDVPVPADYDGDSKADVAVYRPSEGFWYLMQSTAGFSLRQWGLIRDIAVPADYDGDGKADVAVFRPAIGVWYLNQSTAGHSFRQWGLLGDVPVPADYDGDGKTDVAVFRLNGDTWFLNQSTAGIVVMQWGLPLDTPIGGRQ